jgi:beta-N-acetylhexosaminidase
VVQGYLRDQLGFEGLIVTDALRMGAIVKNFGVEESAIRTIEAGVDLIVLPGDARRSVEGLMEAVESGRLEADKITTAARRLLRFKARLGLHVRRQVPLRAVEEKVGDPRIETLARTITERSITVVKNDGDILPLGIGSEAVQPPEDEYASAAPPKAEGPFESRFTLSEQLRTDSQEDSLRVVFLGLSSDPGSGPVGRSFFSPLNQLYPGAAIFDLYPEYSPQQAEELLSALESAHLVVAAVLSRVRDQKGHAAVVDPHATILNYITALEIPVVVAAFGPPYFLSQFPDVDAYLAAYDYSAMAQRAAGEVVLGATGARGNLPVSLPELYPAGWGLNVGPSVGR